MSDFQHISRHGLRLWRTVAVIATVLVGVAGGATAFVFGNGIAAISFAAVALVVLMVAWWSVGRRWDAWGYAEGERDLHVRSGVLVRRLVVVPYGRMQFVEVRQGPLERLVGCANVRLHTAAAATDAHIPWLEQEEADRLRAHLTQLGEAHAAGL